MFKILDGRECFYQWDLDRKLIVEDRSIKQVHYCNKTSNCSLVCAVYEQDGLYIVDVPNILLQTTYRINVYGYDDKYTKHSETFNIIARTKPEDYIYSETELKQWEELKQDIEEVKSYANNTFTNMLKGTARGNTVFIDDLSPLPQVLDIKLENQSNNLIPYPYLFTEYQQDGDRYTVKEDRSIEVFNGSTSGTGVILAENIILAAGTYTLSGSAPDAMAIISVDSKKNGMLAYCYGSNTETFTLTKAYDDIFIQISSDPYGAYGRTMILKPCLNAGTTVSTDTVIDLSTISVSSCGKNWFSAANREVKEFGAASNITVRSFEKDSIYLGVTRSNYYYPNKINSFTVNNANSITFNTADISYGIGFNFNVIPAQQYTISCEKTNINASIGIGFYSVNGDILSHATQKDKTVPYTFTIPDYCYNLQIVFIAPVANTDITFSNIQLELNKSATKYEDYIEGCTITADEKGVISGIEAIYPATTLITNASGIIINAEYNRDINKAFAELQEAIISLGGNI